jgi:hypothetical protein
MIPLRLFMGVQMAGYGMILLFAAPLNFSTTINETNGWMWSAMILFGGLWMVASAAVDMYLAEHWRGLGKAKYRKMASLLAKERMLGYYFSGAVWAGLGYHTVMDGRATATDYLAPSYVVFLLFLAFKDACRKRKRVVSPHENRQIATAFSGGSAPDRRVHP